MRSAIALFAVVAAIGSVHAQDPRATAPVSPRGAQSDPADSLYRVAHELLARGEYGRSAELFKGIGEKFPKSRYQDQVAYNEAFARYRIGTTKELEAASRLLEPRAKIVLGAPDTGDANRGFGRGRARSEGDVAGLYIRVNTVLAQRGNSDAANIIKVSVRPGANSCDADDMDTRVDVIGALSSMDPAQARPILKRVLSNQDPCSVDLRKNAVFMVGRSGDPEAAALIASVAKSDPSPPVRVEAINWLPKLMGDAGVSVLEEAIRTEQDERIQRAVVRTLASTDSPHARQAIRTLIDRNDAPLTQRVEAINAIASQRMSADDAAYLRELYSRSDNEEIRGAVVGYIVRSGKTADWIAVYDGARSLSVRNRIISALETRKESEAADKLVDIAKTSTVGSLRLQAINALARRKDPRVAALLDEIVNGRRP